MENKELISMLDELRKEYFNCYGEAKKAVKQKFKEVQVEMLLHASKYAVVVKTDFTGTTKKVESNKTTRTQKLAEWDPFSYQECTWFETKWMFGFNSGFDIVIGNPPYIQLQKDAGKLADLYQNCGYQSFERTGDIYTLFYERGINLLNNGGHLCYITSNKWMRAGYGESLRRYFLTKNPCLLIDLGSGVFENAVIDTNILLVQNNTNRKYLYGLTLTIEAKNANLTEYVKKFALPLPVMNVEAWVISTDAEQKLKEKIKLSGKPLKDWEVNIYRGALTGLNEAFVIDTATKDRLCAEHPNSIQILKPLLRGRDIKRYSYDWDGLWLISTFPSLNIDINLYPAIKKHLLSFGKDKLEQSGKTLPDGSKSRKLTGHKWFETQDPTAYHSEFEKEKIIYPNMTKYLPFVHDAEKYYTNQKCFIITSNIENLKYFTGYFNSKIAHKWIKDNCADLQGGRWELSKIFFENIPIPSVSIQNHKIIEIIADSATQIIDAKKKNPKANTNTLEGQIDELVYQLYELTSEEIAIVEGKI